MNKEKARLKGYGFVPMLGIAVAFCISVRLAILLGVPVDYGLTPSDPDAYGYLASRIAEGESYSFPGVNQPTAMRPPLYPLLLSLVYILGLGESMFVFMLQPVIDGATCIAIYFFVRELGGTHRAGWISALVWAIYVPEATMTSRLWTEPLAALLTTTSLWTIAAAIKGRGHKWEIVSGIFLGLSALTRSAMLPVAVLVIASLMVVGHCGWKTRLQRSILVLSGCLVTISPWIIRNAFSLGAFVPTTTHGGYTMYEGNCALGDKDFIRNVHGQESSARFNQEIEERYGIFSSSLSEHERDRLYLTEVFRLIRENPRRYILLSLVRFARLWGNVGYGLNEGPSLQSIAVCGLNGLILLGFFIGLILRGRDILPAATPALVTISGMTLLHMATIAYVRYSFPIIPAVIAMMVILLRLDDFSLFQLPRRSSFSTAADKNKEPKSCHLTTTKQLKVQNGRFQ